MTRNNYNNYIAQNLYEEILQIIKKKINKTTDNQEYSQLFQTVSTYYHHAYSELTEKAIRVFKEYSGVHGFV